MSLVLLLIVYLLDGCQLKVSLPSYSPSSPMPVPSASKIASPSSQSAVLSQLSKTAPSSLRVPLTVERLAIVYPKVSSQILVNAYARLAASTFQIKEERPSLRLLERLDLPSLYQEQRLHLSGVVSDETALRVGRLLGANGVLLYQIEAPTVMDKAKARYFGDLPPFTVTSKIVMVESGEVVYLNVITAMVGHPYLLKTPFSSEAEIDMHLRAALDRGINQAITDLRWAFRSID